LISPAVLAVCYPAMDGRREVVVKAHKGETITAVDGFYVVAGHNPGVHGAVLTEALSSRFTFQFEVATDYDLARSLGEGLRAHASPVCLARWRMAPRCCSGPRSPRARRCCTAPSRRAVPALARLCTGWTCAAPAGHIAARAAYPPRQPSLEVPVSEIGKWMGSANSCEIVTGVNSAVPSAESEKVASFAAPSGSSQRPGSVTPILREL
jgi:hypothetical protein